MNQVNRYLIASAIFLGLLVSSSFGAGKVLLIGSGAPDAKDAPLIDKLKKWGFSVDPHGHQEKPAGKPILGDYDLVFISESTGSTNILGAYTNSKIPVVSAETWTYDDMGFSPDGSFNSDPGDELKIVKKDHPITEGLKEKVKVHKPLAQLMTCSGFQRDADIIAVSVDNEKLVAMSVCEGGPN